MKDNLTGKKSNLNNLANQDDVTAQVLTIYGLSFDSIKQTLTYLQNNEPNPGLMNAISILMTLTRCSVKGIKISLFYKLLFNHRKILIFQT